MNFNGAIDDLSRYGSWLVLRSINHLLVGDEIRRRVCSTRSTRQRVWSARCLGPGAHPAAVHPSKPDQRLAKTRCARRSCVQPDVFGEGVAHHAAERNRRQALELADMPVDAGDEERQPDESSGGSSPACRRTPSARRLAWSVSPRDATSSWSNFGFEPASFHVASDWKNSVKARSALGRVLTLPNPTGCFIQCVDQ